MSRKALENIQTKCAHAPLGILKCSSNRIIALSVKRAIRWYFKLELFMKVQVSSIWKKKIYIYMRDNRIRNDDPDGPVYYANH